MRTRSVVVASLLAGALLAGNARDSGGQTPDEASPSAIRILMSMKKAYARCRTYRDRGTVTTTGLIEGGRFGGKVDFATTFVRPAPFRFSFTGDGPGLGEGAAVFVAWTDGAAVRVFWDGAERRAASLQDALDTAAPVSGEASSRVPGMLLPGVVGSGPPLITPERIADADEDGAACFRIRGKSRATPYSVTSGSVTTTVEDETLTLWIDKASHLLRRVEHERTLATYRSIAVTTIRPEIDVEIPAVELAFAPPGSERPSAGDRR